jgi:hypothetical protein
MISNQDDDLTAADVPLQLKQHWPELLGDRPTLRDQFAMAVLSSPRIAGRVSEIAEYCYAIADAMLKARGQNDKQ